MLDPRDYVEKHPLPGPPRELTFCQFSIGRLLLLTFSVCLILAIIKAELLVMALILAFILSFTLAAMVIIALVVREKE